MLGSVKDVIIVYTVVNVEYSILLSHFQKYLMRHFGSASNAIYIYGPLRWIRVRTEKNRINAVRHIEALSSNFLPNCLD